MNKNRVWVFWICLLISCLVAAGCGNTQAAQTKVDSGVINKDYAGTVSPVLAQDYKIKDEAKEGMIKVTIKCGVEKEIPVGGTQGEKEKSGDTDEAKPKI
ncbi:MAG: hypothetical protein GX434_02135 [Peptococcaceae bacterium]|nr:hypothetical protein [Peptococcaceae bacterium]